MRVNSKTRLCAILAVSLLTFSVLMVSGSFTDSWNENSDTKASLVEPTTTAVVDETVNSDLVTDDNPLKPSPEPPIEMEKVPDDPMPQAPQRRILPPPPPPPPPSWQIEDDDDISQDERVTEQYFDLEIIWFKAFETQLHLIVMNNGNMDITSRFTMAICVIPLNRDDGLTDWQFKTVDGLKAGERKGIGFYHSYLGKYEITAYADWEDDINELNENNNVYKAQFDIPAPDLEVIWFKAFETQLHLMVMNNGNKDITSCFTVAICLVPLNRNDIPTDWQFKTVDGLKAGERKGIGFYHSYLGKYEITAYADWEDDINELNENNNVYKAQFDIPAPDLEVIWFKAFETQLHIMIKNNGNKDISSKFTLMLYVRSICDPTDYVEIVIVDWLSKDVDGLKAGERKGLGFYHSYPPGLYELTAVVDYYNDIRELDEGNNRFVDRFEITHPDDNISDTEDPEVRIIPPDSEKWQPGIVPPPDPLPIKIDV